MALNLGGERGSALVIAVLVMAVLTLLGLAYLLMADTENKIAENEKLSAQSLYFGEGVMREVKRWFDRPPYSPAGATNLTRPTIGVMNRTLREFDLDGPGPSAAVRADGSPTRPFYKLGVDGDADGNDDIFDKPYRAALKDTFVGSAAQPDIEMERTNDAATASFLDSLSEKVMPGFPAGAAGVLARIKTIDVFAPPYLDAGNGLWLRYGIATVSVRVQILRNPGAADEQIMADRTISAVLNEMPYAGAFGPLHSCDELGWSGQFGVHWGVVTASTTGDVAVGPYDRMSRSIPRDLPPTVKLDLIHGHLSPAGDSDWDALKNHPNGTAVQDPWFRFFAGLGVQNWSAFDSPQVHLPGTAIPDESNKFQNFLNVPCPEYDYDTWKSIARSGGSDVHYYAWDPVATKFRENGTGNAAELEALTDGKTGLFFFDTRDGLAPHDFDSSNVASNLTPEITIDDPGYGVRGVMYVNAEMWRVSGSPGRPATFTLPGEPFRDKDEDGIWETGEDWINLRYVGFSNIDDPLIVDSTDRFGVTGTADWNARGPAVEHNAILWGVLYLAGQFDANGTPYYDGSVITYAGTETGQKTVGTAKLYWDPTIKDDWPPPGWNLPRVRITRWQTDQRRPPRDDRLLSRHYLMDRGR